MAVTFKRIPQTSEELKMFYRQGDFPWHDRTSLKADPLHSEKNKTILQTVDRLRPVKLLEIGCGGGELLDLIRISIGTVGVGMDICEKGFFGSPSGILKIVGDAEALPIGSAKFDCVISSEIFEHLSDLETALSEVKRVISEKGYMLLTVPNLFCMDSIEGKTRIIERTLRVANRIGNSLGLGNAFPAGWNTHIQKKTVDEWKYTITNAGFIVIDNMPIYIFPYIPYFMNSLKKLEKRLWRMSSVQRIHAATAQIPALGKFGQCHFFLCQKR